MPSPNPLNEFNTYSYHQFLIVSGTTEAAERLDDVNVFYGLISGEYQTEDHVVLINPLKSNKYTIQRSSWSCIIGSNVGSGLSPTPGTSGSMEIIEPLGVEFMSDLQDALITVNAGTASAVFTIKTVFIGDTGVGTDASRLVYINNIRPLHVSWVNLDLTFDEGGGVYTADFVALMSGGANTRSHVVLNGTVNLGGADDATGVTVTRALQNLETRLNKSITAQHEAYKYTLAASSSLAPENAAPKIVIQIPEVIDRPEYLVTSKTATGAGFDGSSPIVAWKPNTPVHDMILDVLRMSPALMRNCVDVNMLFTVHTSVTRNTPGSENREIRTYTVVPTKFEPINNSDDDAIAVQNAQSLNNLIELDYIYTGKNIDVLSFDMKINQGMGFFSNMMTKSATRNHRSEPPSGEYVRSSAATQQVGANGNGVRVHDEGSLPKGPLLNAVAAGDVISYNQMFEQWVIASNVLASVKIRGNSLLLNDVILTSADYQRAMSADGASAQTSTGLAQNILTHPVRAKINVQVPTGGDVTKLKQFWYTGSYRVLEVLNEFDGGEFTQTLSLVVESDDLYTAPAEASSSPAETTSEPIILSTEEATEYQRLRAFLQMIRVGEGTVGDVGYRTMFGGGTFSDFSEHPNTVVVTRGFPKGSTAAGAYQFLSKTWNGVSRRYRLSDFSPVNQDKAAVALIKQRRALQDVKNGDIMSAISKCALEWASLPGSPYGQPTVTLNEAIATYNHYLQQEIQGITTLHATSEQLVV